MRGERSRHASRSGGKPGRNRCTGSPTPCAPWTCSRKPVDLRRDARDRAGHPCHVRQCRPHSRLVLGAAGDRGRRPAVSVLFFGRHRQSRPPTAGRSATATAAHPTTWSWRPPTATVTIVRWQDSVDELVEAVPRRYTRGGNVLIPTFALERAQEILYVLYHAIEERPPAAPSAGIPGFADGDLGHADLHGTSRSRCAPGSSRRLARHDPLQLVGLHMTRETAESMAINRISGGAVIMAGSGMCTGGRIRHHLRHNLWNEANSVIFVGYAAVGYAGAAHHRRRPHACACSATTSPCARRSTPSTASPPTPASTPCWPGSRAAASRARCFLVHGDYDRGMQAFAEQLDRIGQAWHMSGHGRADPAGSFLTSRCIRRASTACAYRPCPRLL